MATPLSETAQFTASVPVPDDGDSATGAGLVAMAQPLADRTQLLKQRIGDSGTVVMVGAGPGLLQRALAATHTLGALSADPSEWYFYAQKGLTLNLEFSKFLPVGATITQIDMRFHGDPASSGSHAGLPATMPKFAFYEDGVLIDEVTDTSVDAGTYDSEHTVSLTGLSTVVDEDKVYSLRYVGEDGAQSTDTAGAYLQFAVSYTF